MRSRAVTNRFFFKPKSSIFLHSCATCSELPSNISTVEILVIMVSEFQNIALSSKNRAGFPGQSLALIVLTFILLSSFTCVSIQNPDLLFYFCFLFLLGIVSAFWLKIGLPENVNLLGELDVPQKFLVVVTRYIMNEMQMKYTLTTITQNGS